MKNEANIHGIVVGGQPSTDELTSGRFKTIINIRGAAEEGNDTGAVLAGTDLSYTSVPWSIDTVTKEDIERIREAVTAGQGTVLIH
jgi:protein tyrosine phosphatase (PTP) superfamily phosphohydrolase (DUF442 family)